MYLYIKNPKKIFPNVYRSKSVSEKVEQVIRDTEYEREVLKKINQQFSIEAINRPQ